MKNQLGGLDMDVEGDEVICKVAGKYEESSIAWDLQSPYDEFRCLFPRH